ncbi:MAG: DUF1295 domain-containing protein [Planctomycetes bacterium]|nr:DUF1295 domain-containing protein [Planctomycetota bacterium]
MESIEASGVQEKALRRGQWLFRWRSIFPLVLVPFLIYALTFGEIMESEYGERFEENLHIICALIALAGLFVRGFTIGYTPSGTSGRNVRKQQASVLNTTGIYSITRNPLYLGNFLIWLGILIFTQNLIVVAVGCLFFFLVYRKIIKAEESFLESTFGEEYTLWREKTPCIIPGFGLWRAPDRKFSWQRLLRREYASIFATIFTFCIIEIFQESFEHGELSVSTESICWFAIGGVFYLAVRQAKKMKLLR